MFATTPIEIIFLLAILGLSVGSFLNVLIYRAHTGMTKRGRSKCMSCGKVLRWYELVPVLSFMFLRGKCSGCGTKISPQYPLVELSAALLLLGMFVSSGISLESTLKETLPFIFGTLFWWVMLMILAYDLRHKIIPDAWVVFAGILALLKLVLISIGEVPPFLSNAIWGMTPMWFEYLSGPVLALPFALIWYLTEGKSMGLGDAKLITVLTWFLGFSQGVTSVILGFWIGAVASIVLLVFFRRKFGMKSEIPFAPFLIVASLAVYFLGIDVTNFVY